MQAFLMASANMPYTIALTILVALGIFELIAMIMGLSLISTLDSWLPIDSDINVDADGITGILGWLCLNRLPLLIWFVLALSSFIISGYTANFVSFKFTQDLLPQIISIPIAVILTLLSCRYFGNVIANLLPKNETSAISIDTLSSCVGTITIGCARKGSPTEAVVRDQFQQKHYVLVEPDIADIEFNQGDQVVLLARKNNVWSATRFD